MRKREEFEALEEQFLAPYAMRSKYTKGRKYAEEEDTYRSCYQRDRDRIIHSTAFRRLEYKTQVFVNHEGDYYRTRLTHTIEVMQIARTIARALGLNEDLTEALALGHDIGHTPFGHAGELALNELMKDKGGFEHNRQGLRVVDELEERYPGFRGLNLTFETREGIVRHTTPYDRPNLKGLEEFNRYISPTLEAQTIGVADQIAYNAHDVDDGLKSGYITVEQIRSVSMWREIEAEVKEEMSGLSEEMRIHKIVRKFIAKQVTDVINESERRIREAGVNSVEEVRKAPTLIVFSPPMLSRQQELRAFLEENLYNHYKVVKIREKSKRYIEALFKAYLKDLKQLPPNFRARIKYDSEEQIVCDYIAGMTDRFAQDEYTRLFMPYAKM